MSSVISRTGRVFLLGLLVFSLAGCGHHESDADFVFLLGAEPETIDPGTASGQPGGRVARNIFEGLVVNDPADLHPVPGIARSWEVSDDGQSYPFYLRESEWSDGTPLTAGDFVFAWERVVDPETASKYANMLYPIRNAEAYNRGEIEDPAELGFRALDDHTLEVTLHSPCAYFLHLCCFYTMLPVPRHTVEKHGEDWIKPEHIVSNGPFVLAEWLLNRRLLFAKNPRYWDAENVALNLAEGIPSDNINANFNLYMSGVVDWADAGAVPLFLVPELLKRPDFHVAPYFNTYFYRFNVTRPPFDDARVRKALFLAMDSEAIARDVTQAGQVPAHGLVPPGLPGYTEARLPERNVEEARRLLAEAGYPDGEGFPHGELLFNTSESHKQIAEVIQQQWKDVLGIEVGLVNQEWKVVLATTRSLDYWIARGGWIGDYLDPNTYLDLWTSGNGNNRTGFADPEYDALINRAARTLDPEERMQLLHQAEDWILNREMIILPIYYYVVQNLYDGRDFSGLTPNLLNLISLKEVKPLRGHRGRPRATKLGKEPMASSSGDASAWAGKGRSE
jgi:oligopeptide transport system substrate-binding protein